MHCFSLCGALVRSAVLELIYCLCFKQPLSMLYQNSCMRVCFSLCAFPSLSLLSSMILLVSSVTAGVHLVFCLRPATPWLVQRGQQGCSHTYVACSTFVALSLMLFLDESSGRLNPITGLLRGLHPLQHCSICVRCSSIAVVWWTGVRLFFDLRACCCPFCKATSVCCLVNQGVS
jgi:hypothetical protein